MTISNSASDARLLAIAEGLRRQGHLVGPAPWHRVPRRTAAVLLGVSEKTLKNRASQGQPPHYRIVLGSAWYDLADLLAYVEAPPVNRAAQLAVPRGPERAYLFWPR